MCDNPLLALGLGRLNSRGRALVKLKASQSPGGVGGDKEADGAVDAAAGAGNGAKEDAGASDIVAAAGLDSRSIQRLYEMLVSKNQQVESDAAGAGAAPSQSVSLQYLKNTVDDFGKRGLEHLECPLCLDRPPVDPVITRCGHTFCRQCIVQQLEFKACVPLRRPCAPPLHAPPAAADAVLLAWLCAV